VENRLKKDFHSAENIARLTFPAFFLIAVVRYRSVNTFQKMASVKSRSQKVNRATFSAEWKSAFKLVLHLANFFRANKQKANVIGW
jgi:hypothetical protein